jgi:hypothetical protein
MREGSSANAPTNSRCSKSALSDLPDDHDRGGWLRRGAGTENVSNVCNADTFESPKLRTKNAENNCPVPDRTTIIVTIIDRPLAFIADCERFCSRPYEAIERCRTNPILGLRSKP